ncbi:hypothetical protein BDQ12DRAFT_730100 [Crucibulum laeve]|uniref:Uncharacterized protein n=1 Tax=Crucibulum laeve TaxID=68775 RepID=A0A5C3LE92_9AGAR|nr:hypothetical protein BDQ12DRAFT_730100 [Crucibulum laeve]
MYVTFLFSTANLASDMILVGFPLYRLWYIKLRPAQRRLVLFVFSTSVLSLFGELTVTTIAYGKLFNGPGAMLVWGMTSSIKRFRYLRAIFRCLSRGAIVSTLVTTTMSRATTSHPIGVTSLQEDYRN